MSRRKNPLPDRRSFLKSSTASTAGLLTLPALSPSALLLGRAVIRVGLIGCGGRGTGAAVNALRADKGVELVALADVFPDRLLECLNHLTTGKGTKDVAARVRVDESRRYSGFEGGRALIESDVDVVLLAETPHFRPVHLARAIAAGKHVFAEKPVAVDAPGVRSALQSAELAKQKGLTLVGGLCWRYDNEKVATIGEVLNGRIGEIRAMQCTYNTGTLWHRGDNPAWSRMEWQLRNWLYFAWLSGDHIAEQHIHSLDKMPWAMGGAYPVKCTANGGRQVRTDPMYGNVYDHFNTTYEWANGVKAFASCRQMAGCSQDVSDHIFGSKGTCHVFEHRCTGEDPWEFEGEPNNMYQEEHNRLFRSIRDGKPINDGDYLAKTTLMSIMGRMAAYTGQTVTWEQAMNSQERLGPTEYSWSDIPVDPIPMPGITRLR